MLDVASTLDMIAVLFEYPAAGYREHLESAAAGYSNSSAITSRVEAMSTITSPSLEP